MSANARTEFLSTQSGCAWGNQRDCRGGTVPVAPSELLGTLAQYQGRGDGGGHLLGLRFNLSRSLTERWLKDHVSLPREFFEALHPGSRSARVELIDDGLMGLLGAFTVSAAWLILRRRSKALEKIDPLQYLSSFIPHLTSGSPPCAFFTAGF